MAAPALSILQLPATLLLLGCAGVPANPPPASAAQEPKQEPDRYAIPMEDDDENVFDQAVLDARVELIVPRVAELRGLDWKHSVPAGVHTPAQFIDFAKLAFEKEFEEGKLDAMAVSLGMFGFLPLGIDFENELLSMLEGMVGGYYDPETTHFYMISTFNQGVMADYIMAHELGHALDDQHYPLTAMQERAAANSDRSWATTCVIEGSASAVGNQYLLQGAMRGWLEGEMEFGSMLGMLDDIDRIPPYLIITMTLPYTQGNAFLVRETNVMAGMVKAPTEEDLVRCFTDPPTSSEQILHPEKYWDEQQFDAPTEVELADRSAEFGEGWRMAESDSMGEIGCSILTMKRVPSAIEVSAGGGNFAHEASSGWDGDVFRLYLHDELGARMDWKSVWDSEEDAAQFVAALEAVVSPRLPTLRSWSISGTTVFVQFAADATALLGAQE